MMLCPTRQVDIPEAFRDWDHDYNRDPTDDVLDDFMITTDIDGHSQTLDFYLGFILDDYKAYKNLSNSDLGDFSKIVYFTKVPDIYPAEFQIFVPKSGTRIQIEVTKETLTLHLQKELR